MSSVTLISPIVKPPVTSIGTVAILLATLAIEALEKSVAVNVFPQDKIPVLKEYLFEPFPQHSSHYSY